VTGTVTDTPLSHERRSGLRGTIKKTIKGGQGANRDPAFSLRVPQ